MVAATRADPGPRTDAPEVSPRIRLWAALLVLGAGILQYRTIVMLTDGSMAILVPWVAATVVVEAVMDAVELVLAGRWWISRSPRDERLALRWGATITIFHALRVLVFVLGRTGPWTDFDVRPERRAANAADWSWTGVYVAATLSVLGVLVVLVLIVMAWRHGRRIRRASREAPPPRAIAEHPARSSAPSRRP